MIGANLIWVFARIPFTVTNRWETYPLALVHGESVELPLCFPSIRVIWHVIGAEILVDNVTDSRLSSSRNGGALRHERHKG